MQLATIGHSNHGIVRFIGMLQAHGIEQLVDIRTLPRSRYNPQFSQEPLAASLAQAGITYRHMKALGGLRKSVPGSLNLGWRDGGFRGYSDYMQTEAFAQALAHTITLATTAHIVLMCAEADPMHCHRKLVSDALTFQGVAVSHILSEQECRPHTVTEFVQFQEGILSYPAPEPAMRDLFQ